MLTRNYYYERILKCTYQSTDIIADIFMFDLTVYLKFMETHLFDHNLNTQAVYCQCLTLSVLKMKKLLPR